MKLDKINCNCLTGVVYKLIPELEKRRNAELGERRERRKMQYASEKKNEKDNKDGKDHLNNTECTLIVTNHFNCILQIAYIIYVYFQ